MTPDSLLAALDDAEYVTSQIASGSSGMATNRGTRLFYAVRSVVNFSVVTHIRIGPRGGVSGRVFLRDTRISPAVDSIRIGDVPDFSRHELLPLSELFWHNDKKEIPNDREILLFLKQKAESLPDESDFYESLFNVGYFDTPANSVFGLQGGAPGLSS